MFEFDPDKSAANRAKHGIDFEQAQRLWLDDRRTVGPVDYEGEDRWMIVELIENKLWSAVVTYRDESIRIISVRRARPKEAAQYDRQTD